MPHINRTQDFKDIVKERENVVPEPKRHKVAKPPSDSSPTDSLSKSYVTEAYNILNYITTLTRMLTSIRKPYLDVNSRAAPSARQLSRSFNLDGTDSSWSSSRQLTNEERDQIDLQARTILRSCADKVKQMEKLEKERSELVASRINPLARLLPAALRQDTSTLASDSIAAHHSSITWYLNRRLAEASQSQKEMQEERVKRQLERTRTLGSGAAREAMILGSAAPAIPAAIPNTGSWLGGASSSLLAAAVGAPSPREYHAPQSQYDNFVPSDDEDDEIELSESQILQFEKENSDMLQSVQETLQSVQQAESRLMEISSLQAELITHLTRQTELTDQLYDDAIAATAMVEKGNAQLKEARRRSKDSRLFILLFLIGASFSLLFLHYY
ncbi:snare protein syntaxin 18/UFE1 [Mycena floridula]|nr:snare protein syntaxin 18/UFE1 [Mycena floridula]